MNPALLFSAYYHHADNVGWLIRSIENAVVHALIFGLVFRLLRQLTLGEAVVLVVAILAVMFLWARARDRRRW